MATYHHISCVHEGGLAIVTLLSSQIHRDEVTEQLRQELLAAHEAITASNWILDMGQTEFFSSAGVPALLSLHRKLQNHRGRLVLCNVRPGVLDMLRVTHLVRERPGQARPFELATNLEEALLRFRHLRAEVQDGVLVLSLIEKELHGDDLAEEMGTAMVYHWQAAQTPKIIIDFTPVQVISTPCMRPLLNLRTLVRPHHGRVVFVHLSPAVQEIFEVTQLVSSHPKNVGLFESASDVGSALRLLNSPLPGPSS